MFWVIRNNKNFKLFECMRNYSIEQRQLNIEISFNNKKSRKQKILSSITFSTSMYDL
jgi:ABC-type uncharacterized transport system substrate-binding protein